MKYLGHIVSFLEYVRKYTPVKDKTSKTTSQMHILFSSFSEIFALEKIANPWCMLRSMQLQLYEPVYFVLEIQKN